MTGKTVLVTGATSGIGEATAKGLAGMGAHVLLVARDEGRGAAVRDDIARHGGNGGAEALLADLSSQRQIRRLAREVEERVERLDVLVNNAGGIFRERRLTDDGLEMTFALNHLGYFLLTELLLDKLVASAPARIVNVASAAGLRAYIDFDDLMGERGYSSWRAYGQSKLANIMFTYELARRLEASGVTANCMHPGFVHTNFGNTGSRVVRLGQNFVNPWRRSPEQGADTVIWLASSPDVEGVTGKYFANRREERTSSESYDEDKQRRLWAVSEELTGLHERQSAA
jgi:retinol dehydrogenase-14